MTIEVATLFTGVAILAGVCIAGGIIYAGLQKVAEALGKQK
jgi:pantothenate kinase type III